MDLCEVTPSTASDLARELGMTIPTAYRLANALAAHNLLRRDEEGRFHLGQRFTASRLNVLTRPALQELTADIGETSQLWVTRGDMRICAVSVVASRELRVELDEGSRIPLSDGGSAVPILKGDIPPRGWVESVSQRTPGACSVSAPVYQDGLVVAAVCVVAPTSRIETTPGTMYGDRAVATARDITAALEG